MEYEAAGMVADAAQVDLERVEVLLRIDRWDEAAPIARQLVNVAFEFTSGTFGEIGFPN